MKRQAVKIQSSKDGKRHFCVDLENQEDLLAYFLKDSSHKKKFRFIVELILSNQRNTELYDKENINGRCKNVTAMKFFKQGENVRIYCKEFRTADKQFFIVAAKYHKKKSSKNSRKEIAIIESIAQYEYEIQS